MPAFCNHSMMEEERLDFEEKIKKRFRVEYLERTYAPVGHVFTVMVEELKIKNPSIKDFIEKLNKYIEIGGCGYAKIKSPLDYFYSLTVSRLGWFLQDMVREGKMSKAQAEKIIHAAYPPYKYKPWIF